MVNTSRRKAVRFATKIPEDVYPAQEKMSLYSPSLFALWKTLESAEGGAWAFLSRLFCPEGLPVTSAFRCVSKSPQQAVGDPSPKREHCPNPT